MTDEALLLVKQLNELLKRDRHIHTCGILFQGDNQFLVAINGGHPVGYRIDDYPDEGESGIEVIAPLDAFDDL